METNSPTIQLCLAGNRAEFDGKIDDARTLFRQAWEAAHAETVTDFIVFGQEENIRWTKTNCMLTSLK
ncbi:MAG: hypothetical protein H6667_02660 [Ardenticatenaceae bacterium]|nr:hypothetical protein [Ardenticatenaceae bacterium]MCB9445642.1 hypothetical protein [Ardenticatenaceae bacterium]